MHEEAWPSWWRVGERGEEETHHLENLDAIKYIPVRLHALYGWVSTRRPISTLEFAAAQLRFYNREEEPRGQRLAGLLGAEVLHDDASKDIGACAVERAGLALPPDDLAELDAVDEDR